MKEEQRRAPLAKALAAYANGGTRPFHTPGHKQGIGADALLQEFITPEGLRADVSLMEELDDLHHPTGCIAEAEALAAELYGAKAAYFMVNGTSGAIHAMMMATLSPGDEVLLPRNVHRSVFNGLVLTGAIPVYLPPVMDERLGIAMGVTTDTVAKALAAHPRAKAILFVYPSYYGVAFDLASAVSLAHARDVVVLVDEAHGAHLRFSEALPPDALSCGADLVAQSTHKLLGSLTQTSLLFRQGDRVSGEAVRRAAALLSTTSPNYLFLASLDIARRQMAEEGEARIDRAVRLAEGVRRVVNDTPGLWCFGRDYMGRPGAEALDVTKVTVQTAWMGLSGAAAAEILRRAYHVACELTDAYNVLFLLTMADREEDVLYLAKALKDLAIRHRRAPLDRPVIPWPEIPKQAAVPREAFFAPSEAVPFSMAEGRIAAEEIAFYPPGIPALCPGERISAALLSYLRAMMGMGLRVTGPADATLKMIRVLR
ncbi:MAG: aminotransferase class I/II-fold pyridoxal phosphate-dependent enzyme [Schwartzia sp. (in: firmicutes)]